VKKKRCLSPLLTTTITGRVSLQIEKDGGRQRREETERLILAKDDLSLFNYGLHPLNLKEEKR